LQQASSVTARALLRRPELNQTAALLASRATERACSANWHLGRLAHEAGDVQTRNAAWEELLQCSARHTLMMQKLAPDDQSLAAAAIKQYPQDATAYFWRAVQETETDPAAAIAYYEDGLALSPDDGLQWVQLGQLREATGDQTGAISAYDHACFNVDRGKNGCPRAARLYMAAGDYERAADRYRTSISQLPSWLPAQRGLADALLAMGRVQEALPYLASLAEQGDAEARQQLQELSGDAP
jgi:tetratricopeptide (TPR) repeat protein